MSDRDWINPYEWLKKGYDETDERPYTKKDVNALIDWADELIALRKGYLEILSNLVGGEVDTFFFNDEGKLCVTYAKPVGDGIFSWSTHKYKRIEPDGGF